MRFLREIQRDPLGWCVIVALALVVVVVLARPARSHSWYDPDCCSDRDCEPVSAITFVASDPGAVPVMVVTTSFGTKPVTSNTKIRESKDSRMHACIYQGVLLCLYLPPSN
ncbi:MAG: hypothetical protein K2X43_02855 [Hyphomonadaceae bacterium]|jgi:hypothetical protein|nr:hypothetical protein [Hyphomonadaceae bacterium]